MLRGRSLAGGASPKCLMALTFLVPTYPHASPFPVFAADPRVQPAFQALFPFSFVVLVDAAVGQRHPQGRRTKTETTPGTRVGLSGPRRTPGTATREDTSEQET